MTTAGPQLVRSCDMTSLTPTSRLLPTTSVSPFRVLLVTTGLIAAGGVFGALASTSALALALTLRGDWQAIFNPLAMPIAAAVGAWLGGVLAPITAWLFLRRTPLWKAVIYTTLAAAATGGLVGSFSIESPGLPMFSALTAFLTTAATLYIKAGPAARPDD